MNFQYASVDEYTLNGGIIPPQHTERTDLQTDNQNYKGTVIGQIIR